MVQFQAFKKKHGFVGPGRHLTLMQYMQYIQVFYYESEWCAHPSAFFIVHCAAINI